jgi:hypothetical protein
MHAPDETPAERLTPPDVGGRGRLPPPDSGSGGPAIQPGVQALFGGPWAQPAPPPPPSAGPPD